jgi:hypothetical protein
MTGPISFEFAGTLFLVVSAVLAGWLHIHHRIKESSDGCRQAVEELRSSHAKLREQVIKEYVSVQTLEKLESKFVASIDRLAEEVKQLVRAVITLQAAERSSGQISKPD